MGNAVEYLAVESPIHRLNPLTKLTGVFTLFSLGLLFANPLVLLSVMILVIFFYFLAKAGRILVWYSKPLLGVGVFLLFIQVLFSHEGAELLRYIPKSIPVLGWIGAVHKDSLLLGLTMITRMGVFALTLPLLLATTQPRDLTLV
jgi:energy-coupling factor transporter transmembrane protein EcfT